MATQVWPGWQTLGDMSDLPSAPLCHHPSSFASPLCRRLPGCGGCVPTLTPQHPPSPESCQGWMWLPGQAADASPAAHHIWLSRIWKGRYATAEPCQGAVPATGLRSVMKTGKDGRIWPKVCLLQSSSAQLEIPWVKLSKRSWPRAQCL